MKDFTLIEKGKLTKHGWLSIVAILLLVIFALSLALGLVVKSKKDKDETANAGGGMYFVPADGSSGISMLEKTISRADYKEYGIMPTAENAKQVTATVTPQNAENAVIDWSVAWKSGASGQWGNGKTVTEYVTVTPTSDGAKTANVQCLKPFGEQIIITAAIRGDESVHGTATVDYLQKYSGITASIKFTHSSTANNLTWALGSSSSVAAGFPGQTKSLSEFQNIYSASGSNKGTYSVTVNTELTDTYTQAASVGEVKVEIAPTSDYISVITGNKGTISQTAGKYLSLGTGTGASAAISGFDFFKAFMISSGNAIDWAGFKRGLSEKTSAKMFDLKLTATVNGSTESKVYALTLTSDTFGTFASGVTVAPNLVF